MMKLCNSPHNEKTPLESRVSSESVVIKADRNKGHLHYSPSLPFSQVPTGNSLVRITGSSLLLGATVGSSTAHRLRTNRILESEAASKAESVMRVLRASTSLYPLQIKGGMVSQSLSLGISGTVPEHTTYPLQYNNLIGEINMSHHGDDWNGSSNIEPETFLKEALLHEQEKLNGLHPAGMLNKNDEGALAYALGTEGGKVCFRFPKPVTWIGFTPDEAMDLAQVLIKRARKAGLTKICTIEL